MKLFSQATTNLLSQVAQNEDSISVVSRPMTAASREARYIEVMRRLQFRKLHLLNISFSLYGLSLSTSNCTSLNLTTTIVSPQNRSS